MEKLILSEEEFVEKNERLSYEMTEILLNIKQDLDREEIKKTFFNFPIETKSKEELSMLSAESLKKKDGLPISKEFKKELFSLDVLPKIKESLPKMTKVGKYLPIKLIISNPLPQPTINGKFSSFVNLLFQGMNTNRPQVQSTIHLPDKQVNLSFILLPKNNANYKSSIDKDIIGEIVSNKVRINNILKNKQTLDFKKQAYDLVKKPLYTAKKPFIKEYFNQFSLQFSPQNAWKGIENYTSNHTFADNLSYKAIKLSDAKKIGIQIHENRKYGNNFIFALKHIHINRIKNGNNVNSSLIKANISENLFKVNHLHKIPLTPLDNSHNLLKENEKNHILLSEIRHKITLFESMKLSDTSFLPINVNKESVKPFHNITFKKKVSQEDPVANMKFTEDLLKKANMDIKFAKISSLDSKLFSKDIIDVIEKLNNHKSFQINYSQVTKNFFSNEEKKCYIDQPVHITPKPIIADKRDSIVMSHPLFEQVDLMAIWSSVNLES